MKKYEKKESFDEKTLELVSGKYAEILTALGEDVKRNGLERTPLRVAKAMQFLTSGYQMDAGEILKAALFDENHNQMVIVKDIELYSLCEHHMLPDRKSTRLNSSHVALSR